MKHAHALDIGLSISRPQTSSPSATISSRSDETALQELKAHLSRTVTQETKGPRMKKVAGRHGTITAIHAASCI